MLLVQRSISMSVSLLLRLVGVAFVQTLHLIMRGGGTIRSRSSKKWILVRQRSLCLQRGSNHSTKDYVLFFSLARSSLIQAWHHRHIDARIDSLPLVLLYCELCNALDYLRHNLNQRNRARILSDFVQICIGKQLKDSFAFRRWTRCSGEQGIRGHACAEL